MKTLQMNRYTLIITVLVIVFGVQACAENDDMFEASGTFEAEEIIISSEVQGKIMEFNITEGQAFASGQYIGYIDSTQLYLSKRQLQAQIAAAEAKKPDIALQLSALREQLNTAETEKNRIINLVKGDAATAKQLDDINAQTELLKKQINAQQSSLSILSDGITNDVETLNIQIETINNQLQKTILKSPVNGTVLAKYTAKDELVMPGKPLYRIADLSELYLRVYITGNQLPEIKLNQTVTVLTDDGKGGYHETEGTVTYISDKAEFTPKTIRTKDERANLVYAAKIKVENDGRYKIGMYGEIKL